MKLPFLNIWITRTDWESLFNYERECREVERKWALSVNERLIDFQKKQPVRDPKTGRFVSKFKSLHDQLRAEVDNQTIGHYDDIKKAGK
jgi:hypothetical protein